jgi:hypothetical protein
MAGIVHVVCAETPLAPEWQGEQRCQQRAGKGGQKKVKRENHTV